MEKSITKQNFLLEKILPLLLLLISIWQIGYRWLAIPIMVSGVDFQKHWDAANVMLEGGNPYIGDLFLGFNYPLFTGVIYLWLAAFSLNTAEMIWEGLSLAYCFASLAIVMYFFKPSVSEKSGKLRCWLHKHWPIVCLFGFSLSEPIQNILLSANIDPLNLLLMTIFLLFYMREKDVSAGFVLAALALVKVLPVVLILPAAAMGRWRVVIACCSVLTLYAIVLLVTGYWEYEIVLYKEVLPLIPYHWMSIAKSLHLLLAEQFFPSVLDDPSTYKTFCTIVNIVLMLVYMPILGWLYITRQKRNHLAVMVFGMMVMLLLGPLLQVNHLCWVTPALFIHLGLWMSGKLRSEIALIALIPWSTTVAFITLGSAVILIGPLEDFHLILQTPAVVLLTFISGWIAFNASPEGEKEDAALSGPV